jgi:uncharacterized protein
MISRAEGLAPLTPRRDREYHYHMKRDTQFKCAKRGLRANLKASGRWSLKKAFTAVTFIVLSAGLVTLAVRAAAERVEDVPNPLETAGKYVGDGAGVLGPAYGNLIDGVCARLKNATGAELAVVTVRGLGGVSPEEFAERLFRRFGIGEKGKDNGLLLLFALDDRAVRFEVGYGLEPIIPDSRAGQLLDDHAIALLARGEYGRGLYAVSKAAAEAVAAASGASIGLAAEPSVWPEQPRPVPAESEHQGSGSGPDAKKGRRASSLSSLILAAVVLGLTGLWIVAALGRFGRARSKADRVKAAGAGIGFIILVWSAASVAMIMLLAKGSPALAVLPFALSPVAANVLWSLTRRGMKSRAAHYRLPCSSCGSLMDLVPEDQDDAQLSTEEAAEEKAGGMDYELWGCPQCGAKEWFAVTLGKASPCHGCARRTLVRTHVILVAATTSHGGRERVTDECKNPKCGYNKTWERDTARIAPPTSGSSSGRSAFSSSSSSSRSSFGGGRSGGGGATRRF